MKGLHPDTGQIQEEWLRDELLKMDSANAKLQAENAKLNREYIKVWEVLRTYNPSDIELKYIGFEDVK
jgi:hypothetical protein